MRYTNYLVTSPLPPAARSAPLQSQRSPAASLCHTTVVLTVSNNKNKVHATYTSSQKAAGPCAFVSCYSTEGRVPQWEPPAHNSVGFLGNAMLPTSTLLHSGGYCQFTTDNHQSLRSACLSAPKKSSCLIGGALSPRLKFNTPQSAAAPSCTASF